MQDPSAETTAPSPAAKDGSRARRSGLPAALRLPMAAGILVFIAAVGTTQLALWATNREADRQLERIGQVYLDGIVASMRAGFDIQDAAYIRERFDHAFAEQRGLVERALIAFAPDGTRIAGHGDPATLAMAGIARDDALAIDEASGTAWASRAVGGQAGAPGRVVVAFDVAPMLEARRRLARTIVLVDLGIAALAALLTWWALHWLGRPLRALVAALSAGAHRAPARLPDALLRGADPRSAAVLHAYNGMVEGLRERERLSAELADREQAAALGRLAATIAHEVRNPLGGLATAVSTLRRFGADPAVRAESLAFLERGIAVLDRIVTSTLSFYRPEKDRWLTRADLEDLALLSRPVAERHGVRLALKLDLPEGDIAPGAGGVRQVLLNLLLNACEATPAGGTVSLHVWRQATELLCEITDGGPGLGLAEAARLAGGAAEGAAPSRRLGLGVVVGLLGNLAGRATVEEGPDGGTVIRLAMPLAPAIGEEMP